MVLYFPSVKTYLDDFLKSKIFAVTFDPDKPPITPLGFLGTFSGGESRLESILEHANSAQPAHSVYKENSKSPDHEIEIELDINNLLKAVLGLFTCEIEMF